MPLQADLAEPQPAGAPLASSTQRAARAEEDALRRQRRSPLVLLTAALARYRKWYLPILFTALILQPPIIVLLNGRNVSSPSLDFYQVEVFSQTAVWTGRALTAITLGMAILSILAWFTSKHRGQIRGERSSRHLDSGSRRVHVKQIHDSNSDQVREERIRRRMLATSRARRLQASVQPEEGSGADAAGRTRRSRGFGRPDQRDKPRRTQQRLSLHWLLLATLAFQLACVIIPQVVGLDPVLPVAVFYAIPVMIAVYVGRRQPHREVLTAVRWSLATLLVASLVAAFVMPEIAVGAAGAEQRLPFLESRLWGLGAGPNSIAPAALVLLILLIQQPRQHSASRLFGSLIAAAAAVIVLLWPQSQTTWAAALVALPIVIARRLFDTEITATRFQAHHVVVALILASIAIVILGAELIRTDALAALEDMLPGSKSTVWKAGGLETAAAIGDQVMTGRGRIWEIAIDTWRDSPLLGFGARAWDPDFRAYHGIPSGVHAHNQWLQVLSVSGLFGMTVFTVYLGLLGWYAWKTSGASRGLTLGLFLVVLVRMISEVPLESRALTTADFAVHLLLLYSIFTYSARVRS